MNGQRVRLRAMEEKGIDTGHVIHHHLNMELNFVKLVDKPFLLYENKFTNV